MKDNEFVPVIDEPYLLFVCAPIVTDADGIRWCHELWAKDLALHLNYLSNVLTCWRDVGV